MTKTPTKTMNTDTDTDMKSWTVHRDGDRPLQFKGSLIGEGTTKDHNSTRWTEVDIYRTAGGKYVAGIKRMTQWQGEDDRHEAFLAEDPAALIDALKGEDGTLGRASQEACEDAETNDEAFAAAWVETIE